MQVYTLDLDFHPMPPTIPLKRWLIPVAAVVLLCGVAAAQDKLPRAPTGRPQSPQPRHSDWEEDEAPPPAPKPSDSHTGIGERRTAGEVSFHLSERLPSLDSRLSPGRIFDVNLLSSQNPENEWQKIPPWLAGVWQVDREVVVEESGYRTNRLSTLPLTTKKQEIRTFGMQRDKDGSIWHYTKVPRFHQVERDGRTEFRLETTNLFSRVGVGQVANFVRYLCVRVEDSTGVILDTRRQENLCLLIPSSNKRMKIGATMRVFDMLGSAATTSTSTVTLHRVKQFSPIKTYRGENMPGLFHAFLTRRVPTSG